MFPELQMKEDGEAITLPLKEQTRPGYLQSEKFVLRSWKDLKLFRTFFSPLSDKGALGYNVYIETAFNIMVYSVKLHVNIFKKHFLHYNFYYIC